MRGFRNWALVFHDIYSNICMLNQRNSLSQDPDSDSLRFLLCVCTKVRTEIIAGITTFLTMSYILAVNPSMFGQLDGMPGGAVFTSTALAAIVGCLAMAFCGKLPFGLAPGMGLNAFFVYSVCMGMGYSWQFALTAVLIEGFVFIILTLTNVREAIVNAIPK